MRCQQLLRRLIVPNPLLLQQYRSVLINSQTNPQASPMATDSATTMDHSNMNNGSVIASDSTSSEYKAAKKLRKAAKKEAKAEKKLSGN